MNRVQPLHTIAKPTKPVAGLPANNAPGGWADDVCGFALVAMVVISMALGAPEPVDCGPDRNAPTIEGCK